MSREIRSILFELGRALAESRRLPEAIEAFDRARAEAGEEPSTFVLLHELAGVRARLGEFGKAFRAYAEAALVAPEQFEQIVDDAHRVLEPLVALQQRDWVLGTWLPQLEPLIAPRLRALAVALAARVALLCDDTDQAIEGLLARASGIDEAAASEAVERHFYVGKLPATLAAGGGRAELVRARIERSLGHLEIALSHVDAALTTELGDARAAALRLAGELLASLGQASGAAKSLLESGRLASQRDDYPAAVDDLARAYALDPTLAAAAWELAEALRMRGAKDPPERFVDEAIRVWTEASARCGPPDKDDAWAYISRALLSDRKAQTRGLSREDVWALIWEASNFAEAAHALASQQINGFWLASSARFLRQLDLRLCAVELARRAVEQGPRTLSALDELAASLANLGHFDEAADVIRRRREQLDDPWCRGVSAYIALFQDRLPDALAELDAMIAEIDESESFWHRELRANARFRAGNFEGALAEFEWICSRASDSTSSDELTVAWATCLSDSLEAGLRRLDALVDPPQHSDGVIDMYAGMCELLLGDHAGVRARRGIARVIYAVELDAFERFTLPLLAASVGPRPQLDDALAGIHEAINARRRALAERPPTPIDELQSIARRRPAASRSAAEELGLRLTLARFEQLAEHWHQAAAIYAELLAEPRCFVAVRVGLQTAVDRLVDAGFELAAAGAERALAEAFEPALSWSSLLELPPLVTKIQAGVAHMALRRGDGELARRSWIAIIEATPNLGELLADCHQRMLASPREYWLLDDRWAELAAAPELDARGRACLNDARVRLGGYLDHLFGGLSEPQSWPVAPIELALSSNLIPATTDDWPLLTTALPLLRERIRTTTGVSLPGVSVRDESTLPGNSYMISLFGVALSGYHDVADNDPELASVLADLEASLRGNLDQFVRVDAVASLLAAWTSEDAPERARIMASLERRIQFVRALRQLVHEHVSIVDGSDVLAAIADDERLELGLDELVELARRRLRRWLPGREAVGAQVTLPDEAEAMILAGLRESGGRALLELSPSTTGEALSLVRERLAGRERATIVVRDPKIRAPLGRLVQLEFPGVVVLAADELEQPEVDHG